MHEQTLNKQSSNTTVDHCLTSLMVPQTNGSAKGLKCICQQNITTVGMLMISTHCKCSV